MSPSPAKGEDVASPKYPPKKPNREAMELLKHSPSAVKDATPPHLNTRSKRGRAVSVTWKAPQNQNVPPGDQNKASLPGIKQEDANESSTTPGTPPSERARRKRSPLKDRMLREDMKDDGNTPESDLKSQATPDSVPPTPHLNTALIETPRVDFTPRAHRRKPFYQPSNGMKDGYEAEILGHHIPSEPSTLESTKVITVLASDESSYTRPPKWSLRQLSPIRNIEDTETKSELTSSLAENTAFAVEDAAVQVSLCQKCHVHSAWSEMKPIVMIFTFLMLSLLYRGLLRVDPMLPAGFGDALGATVQGTFLAAYNLEEYMANIFGI